MTVGERIREFRKKKNWTQAQLASELKVTQQMIGQFENNINPPKVETIERIAKALDVPFYELLNDDFSVQEAEMEFTNACDVLENANFTIDQDNQDIERGVYQICHPEYGTVATKTKEDIINIVNNIVNDSIDVQERYIKKRLELEFIIE